MVKCLASLLLAIAFIQATQAQTVADYAVQLQAQVQQSPPRITISWKSFTNTLTYDVYRKAKGSGTWTNIANLSSADTFYHDNNVIIDSAYEYHVIKNGSGINALGYIYAGIAAPPIHHRGGILLIVDSTFTTTCQDELSRLMRDIRGDGWQVHRVDVLRTLPVPDVKALIVNTRQANPNLNAVLLVGHIAVPYSGNIFPDGHTPQHEGAWPADVFYGDIDGMWTDNLVNITVATRAENDNIPGDGKWDQSHLPSDLELQVGRIDFANMSAFSKTEVQMMKSYLNREHSYKMDSISVMKRGLVDDNFGAFSGEAFAANAWRNFSPLVGRDSIKSADFVPSLNSSSYQWAYGCGAGSYTSCNNVGTTANFTTNNVNAIFVMLFGSYFGDFDAPNCFLRAPLCSNTPALTSTWAGRPNQFHHQMALGEHIGYSTLQSQNNYGAIYGPSNVGARWIHQSLMGDLTLRTDYIKPPGKPSITSSATTGTTITWTASPDAGVIGYYVYRSSSEYGLYKRRSGMISGTLFVDSFGSNGTQFYMVRAVKLQETPSGKYYNLSIGNVESGYAEYFGFDLDVQEIAGSDLDVTIYPNPSTERLNIVIHNATASKASITIHDLNGKTIYSSVTEVSEHGAVMSPEIGHLPAGLYLVEVQNGKNRYTGKWTKNQ
jgi:hypothetical protein